MALEAQAAMSFSMSSFVGQLNYLLCKILWTHWVSDIEFFRVYLGTLMGKKVGSEAVIKGQRQGVDGYVDIEFKVTVGSKEM